MCPGSKGGAKQGANIMAYQVKLLLSKPHTIPEIWLKSLTALYFVGAYRLTHLGITLGSEQNQAKQNPSHSRKIEVMQQDCK